METSVIYNDENQEIIVFAVNRSVKENMNLEISFEDFGECVLAEHIELYNKQPNSADGYLSSYTHLNLTEKYKILHVKLYF